MFCPLPSSRYLHSTSVRPWLSPTEMGGAPSLILPGLWQGGVEDNAWYKEHQITHVVSLGDETPKLKLKGSP